MLTANSGAGNYYSPAALSQAGTFTSASGKEPAHETPGIMPSAKEAPPFAGRGGAGNYGASDERRLLEEELNADGSVRLQDSRQLSHQAVEEVEMTILKPPQAHVDESGGKIVDIWQGTV
jgi:hypothetical protein